MASTGVPHKSSFTVWQTLQNKAYGQHEHDLVVIKTSTNKSNILQIVQSTYNTKYCSLVSNVAIASANWAN